MANYGILPPPAACTFWDSTPSLLLAALSSLFSQDKDGEGENKKVGGEGFAP